MMLFPLDGKKESLRNQKTAKNTEQGVLIKFIIIKIPVVS